MILDSKGRPISKEDLTALRSSGSDSIRSSRSSEIKNVKSEPEISAPKAHKKG